MLNELAKAWADAFSWMLVTVFEQLGWKRSLVAVFLTAGLLAGSGYAITHWLAREKANRERNEMATLEQIEEEADKLSKTVNQNGDFAPPDDASLPVLDAWGNPLRVEYANSPLRHSITVWSDGADGREGTQDDLSASRRVAKDKTEIVKQALQKASDAIGDRFNDRE